jgi:hypothetical protein
MKKLALAPNSCICRNVNCTVPRGLCHCGCGQKTACANRSLAAIYHIKGEPIRFIKGHDKRIIPKIEQALPFKIGGVYCRLIPLTQQQWAIVDADDYKWLMRWKWFVYWDARAKSHYAARNSNSVTEPGADKPYKPYMIYMHREILQLQKGDPLLGDHFNHVTLDNRRSNLRIADQADQSRNQRISTRNTSGYKGVYRTPNEKWVAQIVIGHKTYNIGTFNTREEAHAAYCEAAIKHFGEFACFA